VCTDGSGYIFSADGSEVSVSRYDPSHPEAGVTGGPWPTTQLGIAEFEWVDPELQHSCYFFQGITRSSAVGGGCQPTTP
jgi:hypothetical protein